MIREDMMERMSMDEFLGWMAYSEIEPFGEDREDLRAGIAWSQQAHIHTDPKFASKYTVDKYPLFKMQQRNDRPALTSQSLFGVMKKLSEVNSKTKPS